MESNYVMPGRRASCSHLPLIVMPQRCSVLHGVGIGDQDGCQARVFCNPTRPKSEPKSATFGGSDSRNNLMPGRRASRSHLLLIVMPQENLPPRVCGMFYKAVVQSVLLYGSETWTLSASSMKCLEGFHYLAVCRMARVNRPRRARGDVPIEGCRF